MNFPRYKLAPLPRHTSPVPFFVLRIKVQGRCGNSAVLEGEEFLVSAINRVKFFHPIWGHQKGHWGCQHVAGVMFTSQSGSMDRC